MHSVSEFVLYGKIGKIFLGMTRQQALGLVGEPKDWLGKKTIIGEHHEFFNHSDLWFYYEGSVGVRFGADGVAGSVIVYPKNAARCPNLFKGWPAMSDLRMGEWRAAINNIPFRESERHSLNYWIVAADTCVTCCLPLIEETETECDGYSRDVLMLQKYSTVEMMEEQAAYVKSGFE